MTERDPGYGWPHQQDRRRWARRVASGLVLCRRCGNPILVVNGGRAEERTQLNCRQGSGRCGTTTGKGCAVPAACSGRSPRQGALPRRDCAGALRPSCRPGRRDVHRARRPLPRRPCHGTRCIDRQDAEAPARLAAGVSTFELSRVMGTSIAMIDQHYGHLARDSEESIRARLDARSRQSGVYLASESE